MFRNYLLKLVRDGETKCNLGYVHENVKKVLYTVITVPKIPGMPDIDPAKTACQEAKKKYPNYPNIKELILLDTEFDENFGQTVPPDSTPMSIT